MIVESAFLVVLLLLPARGDDGCASDQWKCGDICQRHEIKCDCGGSEFSYSDHMWCCNTETCTWEKSPSFGYILASCEGAAVSLTEPCQGGRNQGKCPAETGITRIHYSNSTCNLIKETEENEPIPTTTEATNNKEKAQTKETTTTNANRQSIEDKNLTIILIVAGALLFLVIAACCSLKLYKSKRRSNSVVKEDFNPVYGDYSDIYQPTEIYDRNPDYAAADMEETAVTVIRDNNPEYE